MSEWSSEETQRALAELADERPARGDCDPSCRIAEQERDQLLADLPARDAAIEARVRAELAAEPIRVIVVVNWHTGRVHGMTCDQSVAQGWVRELIERYDDGGAASQTVDLVTRAGSSPDTTPPLDMGFLSLPPEIQAAARTTPRLDDCGVCDLVPTVSGYVRGVQVSCPVHGTTPEPRQIKVNLPPRQIKVNLLLSWLPFSVEAENHPFTDEQRQALAGHEDHQTAGAWSAFGWRELRCVTCDASVWSVTT